jgi:hypothetical protein
MVFAFLVLLSNFSFAQEVLAPSGGAGQNSSGSISYTFGELVIDTQTSSNTTITQGFHQTQIVVTAITEPSMPGFRVVVFPNPANDFVTLKIEKGEIQNVEFVLFDAQGKFLLKGKLTDTEQKVSFEQLNTGNYVIKIFKNGREIQAFKIVKITQ